MQRVSRRINGRVVKGYLVDGKFYRTKAEAGLSRKPHKQHRQRSDKKPVSQNNVVQVALKLLGEYEVPLVTALEAAYRDTGDAETLNLLRLIGATKDAVSDIVFLAGFCQPSAGFYTERRTLALQLAYKFVLEFFPEELENPENITLGTFRPRRAAREHYSMDDGTGEDNFRFADSGTVDSVRFRV